ncbi:uncharacterized protein LOC141601443 [Silene latifolia]|uniref:uncharacterized protein LOC141601443 n=1 Tax=Silene latifolia TaxID=37657 RepID=UPI003D782498
MKSNVYGNGLESGLLEKFASTTGLKIGKLPFKYSGVPISAKKLSVLDCNILVERIVDRIRGLGAKILSYAGRLVLIKSVLGTLHSYWARIYIIPSSIMAKIESTCRSFLWKGDAHSNSNALVSWKQVCLPKEQGGLGVCDIGRWNVGSQRKVCPWVMDKKDHLWVKWVHCTYLKSVPWTDYTPSQSSSWAWKRICRVKDILLSSYIQHDWLEKDAPYSISSGYDWLGTEASNVPWYKHIWITDGIPKHQFITGSVQDWSKLAIPERQVLSWWQAQDKNRGVFTSLVVMALVYHIWWARNHCRFQQVIWRPEVVGARIKQEVQARIGSQNKSRKKLIWTNLNS